MRQNLHALYILDLIADVRRARRRRLHPRLIQLPRQPLDLSVFLFQFDFQSVGKRRRFLRE